MVELILPGRFHPSFVYGQKELKDGTVPRRTRHVWCFDCKLKGTKTELASEAGDIGTQADEWWSVTASGEWRSGKWWGNHFICPVCKVEGNLPQDKPLMEEE